jgi:hypothetical protein
MSRPRNARRSELDVVEPGQQNLPQRDAACGTVARNRIRGLYKLALETEQLAHLFGEEADRVVRRPARSIEDVERLGRQAFMQARAAGRTDVNPVALQSVRGRAVALVDGRADADAFEALGKRQTANAAANDENMKRFGHGKLLRDLKQRGDVPGALHRVRCSRGAFAGSLKVRA